MGLFGILAPNNEITEEIENATDENNTEENWEKIINICDKAGKSQEEAKSYLRAIIRRLQNQDPHIAIQAASLLDACVKNSGRIFHVEIASREFETEFNKLLQKSHQKVSKKLRESLKRWAENEFRHDPQLVLIPSLYTKLKNTGVDFNFANDMPAKKSAAPVSKDPNVVDSLEEESQILKAIELSLKETGGSPHRTTSAPATSAASTLYPSVSAGATASGFSAGSSGALANHHHSEPKEAKKVRALYDFEAAEDNELTFTSGEIIFVIDDSDTNWWKGSNQRGEGLFPSNFVTTDLDVQPEELLYEKAKKKIVQFKDDENNISKVPEEPPATIVEVDEEKIDRLLYLLHEADPTNPETDTQEMLRLEVGVNSMGPLIDSELERVDRKHAQLTQLSADLVEALGLYHELMREPQYAVSQMPHKIYGYNPLPQHSQQQPVSMGYTNGLPPPGMMRPPPGLERPPMSGGGALPHMHQMHHGMGPPPQMMMGSMPPPDDRRMIYGGGPPIYPPPQQMMIHSGPPFPPPNFSGATSTPPQSQQQQFQPPNQQPFLPSSPANNKI